MSRGLCWVCGGGREVNREGAEGAKFLGEGFGGGREDNWMGR
jgi:hypothetical protein